MIHLEPFLALHLYHSSGLFNPQILPSHPYFYINDLIIENTLQTCITYPLRLSQSTLIHNAHHYTLDLTALLTITHIYFGFVAPLNITIGGV